MWPTSEIYRSKVTLTMTTPSSDHGSPERVTPPRHLRSVDANGRPAPHPSALPRPELSVREVEVLVAWLRTDSKEEAGQSLFISPATVKTHVSRIRAKYAAAGRPANSKSSLFVRAVQDGYISMADWETD